MSIILEGQINRELKSGSNDEGCGDSPDLCFKGDWYFIREKSSTLPFKYAYKSAEVPKDLIDFVSFIDHKPSANKTVIQSAKKKGRSRTARSKNQRVRNNSKTGNGKKMRCDSTGLPLTDDQTITLEDVVSTKSAIEMGDIKEIKKECTITTSGMNDDTTTNTCELKDGMMVIDDGNPDGLDGKDGSVQGEEDEEDDDVGPDDSSIIADSDIVPNELKGAETVKIDRKHPLFGLWEGSFGLGVVLPAPAVAPKSAEAGAEVTTGSVREEAKTQSEADAKDQMEVVKTEDSTATTTTSIEEPIPGSTTATTIDAILTDTTTPINSAVTVDATGVPPVDTSATPATGDEIDNSNVPETFFFHSYLNVEPMNKGLEVLPSEPCFTYTVIKSLKKVIVPSKLANEILGVDDSNSKVQPQAKSKKSIASVVKEENQGKGKHKDQATTSTASSAPVAALSTMAVDPSKVIVQSWSSSNLDATVPMNILDDAIPVRTHMGSLSAQGTTSVKSSDVKAESNGKGVKVEAEVAATTTTVNDKSPQKTESTTETLAATSYDDMDVPSTPPIKSTPDIYGLNAPVKPEASDNNQLDTDAGGNTDTASSAQDATDMATKNDSLSDSSVKLLLMNSDADEVSKEENSSANKTIVNGATDGTDSTGLIILVGFGRNKFGRFSIVASYNPATSALIAEKRYMLSKNATNARKTRRATTVVNPNLGIAIGSSLGQRSAAANNIHTNSSLANRFSTDGEYYSGAFPLSLASSASKKRKNSHVDQDAIDEDEEDGTDPEYKSAYYDESSGDVYEGGWHPKFKVRHGRGVLLYNDGNMYEGTFNMGKEHGKGKLMAGNRKIIYSGDWQEGTFHGHGKYYFFNKDVYEGDFREGARSGKGSYTTSDNCVYTGEWRDNKRHGKGSFVWPDGSSYDGEWENDMRQGKGHLLLTKGVEYEGAFSRNALDGRGTFIFPGGLKYEGAFRAGLREGRGSLSFAEGAIYEGRFREDRLDGQGTVKVHKAVPGPLDGETMIPIEIQADIRRIHLKAGFGADEH
jgi:hypothetical protein